MLELVPAKSILARNKDPRWFGIDYQMNLYRGCCHGCIYCDSRSECYGIEEFDRVRGKKMPWPCWRRSCATNEKPG